MKIDLKNSENLTYTNVKELIASKDDSVNRQLRISNDGFAYISDDCGFKNLENVLCRFETWSAGNGYCGIDASNDSRYVKEVLMNLKENYPEPKNSYIDY